MPAQAAERTRPLAKLDVVVLAGGRGSRLGGIDKSALVYAGAPLRRHILSSVRAARRVVWVGDRTAGLAGDAWPELIIAREAPVFAGPSAALAAGLHALETDPAAFTLVLAADLPRGAGAVQELLRQFENHSAGVLAIDELGRRQFLLAVYPSRALRTQVRLLSETGSLNGLPLRRLIDALELTEVRLDAGLCADIDTPEDAARHGIRLPLPVEKGADS